jgi:hypothetical protein
MARTSVFYSFHFDNDVFRVQQIRNMGIVDGDTPVSANDWETIKRRGDAAVESWIDENMKWRRCVVVLIGEETASRRWVRYEIGKAWDEGRGLVGVRIHNLKDPRYGTSGAGPNPFEKIKLKSGNTVANYVTVHDPWYDAYSEIKSNLADWVDAAVEEAKHRF